MAQLLASLDLDRSIDRDGELPVGVQLTWRLRALIHGGTLARGERLPSVREVAQLCQVNVNTARAAYAHLEQEGLLVSRQGSGTFVSEDAPRRPDLDRLASEAIAEAREAGIDAHELASAMYVSAGPAARHPAAPPARRDLSDGDGNTPESLESRRELRRQIAHLEAQLAAYADPEPKRAVLPAAAPRELGVVPHLAGLAELERTRDRLLDQLRLAGEESERRGTREATARRRVERMAENPKRHRWEWVSSADTGDPDCKTYSVSPQWGPVGAAMGWWRIRVSGGCPLAGAA
jgi:DNA-binding transcriptional regulator YhcF (GntR family)